MIFTSFLLAVGSVDTALHPMVSAAPVVATTRMNSRRSICNVEDAVGAIFTLRFGHSLNQNLVND